MMDNLFFGTMTKTDSNLKPSSRFNVSTFQRFSALSAEICILAGGSSTRMGRDKSRLRLGRTTMLGHIRKTAGATGLPVRVIRRDCVPKCGPLAGIYTALKTTPADVVLFLACDMPLITTALVELVLQHVQRSSLNTKVSISVALFVRTRGRVGFPFVLARESVESVCQQIEKREFSLQSLAEAVEAITIPLTRKWSHQLLNVNTPKHWSAVRGEHLRRRILPCSGHH